MSEFNVLISSAGRRVVLVQLFQRALRDLALAGKVYACDVSTLSAAYHSADGAFLVPRCTSEDFVDRLLQLCRERAIRLIVPTIDTELAVYAANRARFATEGVEIAVSSSDAVGICADKVSTHAWLLENDLPTIRQTSPEAVVAAPEGWRYPLIVKPRAGSLSVGVARVADPEALLRATSAGGFVVQTIAPGSEYTIDFLASRSGSWVCAVPRKRLEVRGGEISKGLTVREEKLEVLARRVCEALPGAYGCLNVQVFWDPETDALNVIEINARFGGGYPLSWEAGAHYPRWIIEEIAGLPSTASNTHWEAGLTMLRYDAAVFVRSERPRA